MSHYLHYFGDLRFSLIAVSPQFKAAVYLLAFAILADAVIYLAPYSFVIPLGLNRIRSSC